MATCRRSWTRSSSTAARVPWATARCSSCPSRPATASARGRPGRRPCRPTPTRRRRSTSNGSALDPMSGKAERAAGPLIERLRGVHLAMVEAVLGGDGLREVARLASQAAGAPVAVIVPQVEVAAVWPDATDVEPLRLYVADRLRDRPANVPVGVEAEVPIVSGDDQVGAVLMLGPGNAEAAEF